MKAIDDLTIQQVMVPVGRSVTEDELDVAERALLTLLHRWETETLKPKLRGTLRREIEREYAFITDYDLMRPAELYQLINAAQLLSKYLLDRSYRRIERRAAVGDPEALKDLALLNDSAT